MTPTATETADILAAWQLIEENGLSPIPGISGWAIACGDATPNTIGESLVAAVKAWAESAGVPWEPPQVVERWACQTHNGIGAAYTSPESAAVVVDIAGFGEVVPCVVVMTEPQP